MRLIGLTLVPPAAEAQQGGKVWRIGYPAGGHLDAPRACRRDLRGHADGVVQIAGLDQVADEDRQHERPAEAVAPSVGPVNVT